MSARETPDGYLYGVRFGDGSVLHSWNGRTQRDRAEEKAAKLREHFTRDTFEVVRRRAPGDEWEALPCNRCGYPDGSFACRIRHIHMNTGDAKASRDIDGGSR